MALTETDVTDPQGRQLKVSYPSLDMGEIKNTFDGDGNSLIRTLETNPMRLQIKPVDPFLLSQVTIRIGGTASTVTIRITPMDGSEAQEQVKDVPEANDIRDIAFALKKPVNVKQIDLTILDKNDNDRAHVHLWEVSLN
jgi:hypothetical protein